MGMGAFDKPPGLLAVDELAAVNCPVDVCRHGMKAALRPINVFAGLIQADMMTLAPALVSGLANGGSCAARLSGFSHR